MPRRVPRESSRPGVELVDIASPYTGTDRVLRRVDSLARLHRSGVINDRQMRAGDKYRRAAEIVHGQIACALAGNGTKLGPRSRTPSLAVLQAARDFSLATRYLGEVDGSVVSLICGYGYSITETANKLFPSQSERKQVSYRLRWALHNLANFWFGPEAPVRGHHWQMPDAKPMAGNLGELIPSKVAHASRRGVSYDE